MKFNVKDIQSSDSDQSEKLSQELTKTIHYQKKTLQLKAPFIAVEGVNGAGKSTLIKKLERYIHSNTHFHSKYTGIISTREPGGTEFGLKIRDIVLNQHTYNLTNTSEVLLFAADRSEHIANVILPALQKGKIVISDRFYYSFLAFQGYGRSFDMDVLNFLIEKTTYQVQPTITILLDLDPRTGLQRNKEKSEIDSIEKEKADFHLRIRDGFIKLAEERSEICFVVDASMTPENVYETTVKIINFVVQSFSTL